ncbi:MAG: ribulose-phosphate 3-epimerase [Clostridiales bacterium GWF2_38_85]|nr:MAG: ribulose-phosphate 3-epimerase [Clostridiales bacterium GWF2_38_85]HBL85446.1 ribulose-phosphate 3-epimerase [Clostridiales bacterium]
MKKIIIAPSILSCDFTRMGDQIKEVESAGCSFLHIDVMDGVFVPNISIGQPVVKSLRKATKSILDTHLMIINPERYIDSFIDAGSDIITIHIESSDKTFETLKYIRSKGIKAAVSIKPKTSPDVLKPLLPYCDMILVMTVEPGFGGQKLIHEALDNLREVRKLVDESSYNIDIEVDGGIDVTNIKEAALAGANVFVAGSAVFGKPGVATAYKALNDVLNY